MWLASALVTVQVQVVLHTTIDNYKNVSAGRVEADSLDAINGSQLYAVVDEVNTIGGTVNGHTQQINRNANNIGSNTNRINNLEALLTLTLLLLTI